jgi:CubicO group peptidase (beta-lactamase class C family)
MSTTRIVEARSTGPVDGARLPTATAVCEHALRSGAVLGVYLHVRYRDEVVADVAFGEAAPGVPAAPDDLGELRCAVKPLTTLCVARAMEDGLLSLDDAVGRWASAGSSPRVAALSVRQLLTHTSGLPNRIGPDVYQVGFDEYVTNILTAAFLPMMWDARPIYSLARAWHLLAWIVQRVYSRPIADLVRELITQPLGLSTLTLLDPREMSRPFQRRTVDGGFVEIRDTDPVSFGTRENPAYGGFGTTGDLGCLYAHLGHCLNDGGLVRHETMRLLTRPTGVVRFRATEQPLPFGSGFFLGGAAAAFGPEWDTDCFGHMGSIGRYYSVVGLCAPGSHTVVAARLASVGRANNDLLTALGQAIRRDLALPDTRRYP